MRRILIASLALAAVAVAACRVYDVDVYQNVNGWTHAQPNNWAAQSFTCTVDSLLWAEVFVGAANTGGQYNFDIRELSSGDLAYSGHELVSGQNYTYVRCSSLVRTKFLIKGKEYVLKVTLQSQNPNDSINFYYSDQNPYVYGHLIEPGQDQNHPEEYYWKDLSCRIEGIVYNNPEMVGTWDMIPAHMVDESATHRPATKDEAKTAIQNGADMMAKLGIKSNRIVDLWRFVQPYPDSQNLFIWDTMDFCWRTLASHGIHPHLVAQGGGPWRLDDSVVAHRGREGNFWPTNMFLPVKVNGAINPNNHLAWFYYNYAKRYGPGGTFWLENTDAPYLPLLYVECCNEPTYAWRPYVWGHDTTSSNNHPWDLGVRGHNT